MRIGLDIDYVLINFDEGVYDYYDKQYVEKVARDTFIDEIYEELRHNKEFYLKLKPRINPIYIDFPFECYITARDINPYITYMNLQQHGFPNKPIFNVGVNGIEANSKADIINELKLDYFIDDSIKHFNEINNETDCVCFLMDRLNNKHIDTPLRINHISEFYNQCKYYEQRRI